MKKLLVINPNSSDQMTQDIRSTLSALEDEAFSIEVIKMPGSPEVLESFADYTIAGGEMIKTIRTMQESGTFDYSGVLVACMGDPCLYGVKEVCPVPVIGVAEAAISTALLLGYKFSIVASSSKAKPMMESMVMTYGLLDRMASVETMEQPIANFMEDPDVLRNGVRDAASRAQERGAEVLLLGCAGMTMLSNEMDTLVSMPVIDPVKAGLEQLKTILRGNFKLSRNGLYA